VGSKGLASEVAGKVRKRDGRGVLATRGGEESE